MKKDEIGVCINLIKRLRKKNISIEENNKLRNDLYDILQTHIIKWMSSILRDRNYYSKNELLSLSWDCFLFCLKYFKLERNIPIPNHFYAYTKFFLLSQYPKILTNNTGGCLYTDDVFIYEALDELKKFREDLPDNYQTVFDDALMSMSNCRKDHVRRLERTNIKYYQYCEAKKIMKIMIDFLLRR